MLRIGIDEAGLGPLLGPLVVAGASFRVTGASDPFDADLRSLLAGALAPAPGRRGGGGGALVVGDSKQVFGPTKDLARLELPVLAFVAASQDDADVPASLDDLLRRVAARPDERRGLPWYAGDDSALPRAVPRETVREAAAAVRTAAASSGVRFLGFAADVVPEDRLNRDLERAGNKADVLFARSADVLERLLAAREAAEGAGVAFDRLGGRRFYGAPIAARWPAHFAWALEEGELRSRYHVRLPDADAEFRWTVGGDGEHLETGIASMLAKYLRELFMERWNAHFAAICPGVDATAGYALDARRWLRATRAARDAAGVPDARLLRVR